MRYDRDGWSIEQGFAKGRYTAETAPQWYRDEPPEIEGDEFYLCAFWDLSTCRPSGFGASPIPWNHIRDYAEFAGLDRVNALAFSLIIRKMDGAYLDHAKAEEGKRRPGQDDKGGQRETIARPPVNRPRGRGK